MLLKIDDYETTDELKDKFAACFPRLKILFFREPHHWQENNKDNEITEDVAIGDIRNHHDPGILEIHSTSKAGAVEKEFKHRFGLNIQIVYYKNNEWIQTSQTDSLTLKELSEL